MASGNNVGASPLGNLQHGLKLPGFRDIIVINKEDILSTGMLGTSVPSGSQVPVGLPQHLPTTFLPPLPSKLLKERDSLRVGTAIINEDDFKVLEGLLFDGFDGLLEELVTVVMDQDNRCQWSVVRVLPGWQVYDRTVNSRSITQIRQQLVPLPLILLHTHLRPTQQYYRDVLE